MLVLTAFILPSRALTNFSAPAEVEVRSLSADITLRSVE